MSQWIPWFVTWALLLLIVVRIGGAVARWREEGRDVLAKLVSIAAQIREQAGDELEQLRHDVEQLRDELVQLGDEVQARLGGDDMARTEQHAQEDFELFFFKRTWVDEGEFTGKFEIAASKALTNHDDQVEPAARQLAVMMGMLQSYNIPREWLTYPSVLDTEEPQAHARGWVLAALRLHRLMDEQED